MEQHERTNPILDVTGHQVLQQHRWKYLCILCYSNTPTDTRNPFLPTVVCNNIREAKDLCHKPTTAASSNSFWHPALAKKKRFIRKPRHMQAICPYSIHGYTLVSYHQGAENQQKSVWGQRGSWAVVESPLLVHKAHRLDRRQIGQKEDILIYMDISLDWI